MRTIYSSSSSPMRPDQLQLLEHMTQNAGAVQQSLLAQILAHNAETEYLKGFSGDEAMDVEMFKSKVPMVKYEDIQPLIRRMADGDHSPILCAQPISQFLMSSGSVGEPKLIPLIKEVMDRNLLFCSLLMPVINKHVKGLEQGMGLNFMFTRPDTRTRDGTTVRLSTSTLYKSDAMKNRPANFYTSPNEAIFCPDPFQSMYTQLLCGLHERTRVNRIETTFASTLVRVLKFLQINWKQLTHDIRTGSLDPRVTDGSIREYMARTYQPDVELADSIASECAKDNWEGIITRIWPHAKYLGTIATGSMAQYVPTLDYYSCRLPIISMVYASSESYLGINLNPTSKPSEVSYTFMPFVAYFEFLPQEAGDNSEQPVDLVNVLIGKEYEVVITNGAGLYRYRLGDIVRVTGFYNSAPQFQFVRRKDVLLSIEWEKTKETELQAAVEKAAWILHPFGMGVADYTSFVDTTSVPDHYVLYWELQGSGNLAGEELLGRCCLAVEESLNLAYRTLRAGDGPIGPLEIRVVGNGAFEEVMENAVSRGASISQYKVPRCVGSSKPMKDILESRVVSRHFSPSPPSLSPVSEKKEYVNGD